MVIIMKNVAFRKILFEDAVKKEKKVRKESDISYGLNLTIMNLEDLYKSDMDAGIGIMIDPSCDYTDIASNISDLVDSNSLYSYKFSIRSNDTQFAKVNRYRCKCGDVTSELAGVMCKKCGTETYNHIAIRGWFDLGNLKVFNPFYWARFRANCKYPSIVDFVVDKQAKRNTYIRSQLKDKDPDKLSATFMKDIERVENMPNIMDLQDREVLYNFIAEYANDDAVEYLLQNIDSAMTSKIPVINKNMRNISIRVNLVGVSDTRSNDMNKYYTSISKNIYSLTGKTTEHTAESVIRNTLVSINEHFRSIYNECMKTLGVGKKSLIRGRVGGRRKGYSSRIVLEGALRHKVDEVAMPYKFFGQMTIDYHADIYKKLGVTPEASYRIRSNIPNENDCRMMDEVLRILTSDNLNVLIVLRQPAIYRESMVALRLVELHHKDVVTVNEMVIDSCLYGDKDGDVVSVFLPDPSIRTQLLFALSPNKRIFNPLTVSVEPSMELVEAGYVNTCLIIPKERHESGIVTKEELRRLGYEI
jgi:hypothetical protein